MDHTALSNALNALGYVRFSDKSGHPKHNAQRNLSGITHYADDDALRYFYARITGAAPISEGLLFRIVESVALDMNNTRRGFRFVVFDVFGTVIERPDLENCHNTSNAARKAFECWYGQFDVLAYYRTEIQRIADRKASELDALGSILADLQPQAKAA